MLAIWNALDGLSFEKIHGGWKHKDVTENGKAVLLKSIKRLIQHMDHSEYLKSLPA